jgi:hypothetical protein
LILVETGDVYLKLQEKQFDQLIIVRHGYPWIPIDQAHGRPQQVGSAY